MTLSKRSNVSKAQSNVKDMLKVLERCAANTASGPGSRSKKRAKTRSAITDFLKALSLQTSSVARCRKKRSENPVAGRKFPRFVGNTAARYAYARPRGGTFHVE